MSHKASGCEEQTPVGMDGAEPNTLPFNFNYKFTLLGKPSLFSIFSEGFVEPSTCVPGEDFRNWMLYTKSL